MCYSALVKRSLEYYAVKYGSAWVREQLEDYDEDMKRDPRKFPPLKSRIYPGSYTPVEFDQSGKPSASLMRYGAYPPMKVASDRKYDSYNARSDNLTSPFWSNAFGKNHGFVIIEAFYEWVMVTDLLSAGVVTIDEVKAKFEKQTEERKAKILASGKKYKPTPTEQLAPENRKIIIEFRPNDGADLVAPTIFSFSHKSDDKRPGFAIVTTDPSTEVLAAGHDRSPIFLQEAALKDWLEPEGKSAEDLKEILKQKKQAVFKHRLDIA